LQDPERVERCDAAVIVYVSREVVPAADGEIECDRSIGGGNPPIAIGITF